MPPPDPSRRAFLAGAGRGLVGGWLAYSLPALLATGAYACRAQQEGAAFETLTPGEAAELEAVAAQIIPTDDTPGAREAGVIYFIDRALGTFMASALETVRTGLAELQAAAGEAHPGVGVFSGLTAGQQIALLQGIEDTPFFGTVRYMTIAGLLAHPSHGGNRDKIGWQLIGFEDRHAWQPPFGYYDAQVTGEEG